MKPGIKNLIKILIFIGVCNINLPSALISLLIGENGFKTPGCQYINGSGKFRKSSFRRLKEGSRFKFGNGYEFAKRDYRTYRLDNPEDTTALYRRFPINPLKFWRYWEYITCDCYELPYMSDRKAEQLIRKLKRQEEEEYRSGFKEADGRNREAGS